MLRICCFLALLLGISAVRWDLGVPERSGRQLLDITLNVTTTTANSTLQVFSLSNFNSSSQCIIQGYPGSRADSVVSGPLVVNVPVGSAYKLSFGSLTNGAIVALYNQTANSTLVTSYNGTYGLISVSFYANDSAAVGQTAYITAGRVDAYNNSDPNHSWNSLPTCLVNVTFKVVPYVPPPPPPLASPSTPGLLSGLMGGNFQLPKNPCYCTPVVGGKAVCFNFNQAGSDINCTPGAGFQCTSIQALAGLYTQAAGPVYDCTVTSAGVSG